MKVFLVCVLFFSFQSFQTYGEILANPYPPKTKNKAGKIRDGYYIDLNKKKVNCKLVTPYKTDVLLHVKTIEKNRKKKKRYTSEVIEFGYKSGNEIIVYKLKKIPTNRVSILNRKQFCRVHDEGTVNLYSFYALNPTDPRPNNFRRMFFIEYDGQRITAFKKKKFKLLLSRALSKGRIKAPRRFYYNSDKIIDLVKKLNQKTAN